MYSQFGPSRQTITFAKAYQAEQLRAAPKSRLVAPLRNKRPRDRSRFRGLAATLTLRARDTRPGVPKVS